MIKHLDLGGFQHAAMIAQLLKFMTLLCHFWHMKSMRGLTHRTSEASYLQSNLTPCHYHCFPVMIMTTIQLSFPFMAG